MIIDNVLYAGGSKPNSGESGGGAPTGGSDTFEAQLILDNVVNSGVKKTESSVVNETVAVLEDILGE